MLLYLPFKKLFYGFAIEDPITISILLPGQRCMGFQFLVLWICHTFAFILHSSFRHVSSSSFVIVSGHSAYLDYIHGCPSVKVVSKFIFSKFV